MLESHWLLYVVVFFYKIGVAVGKERFLADANDVMTEMLHTQVLDASDPQISFFEAAFARIAECLGMEFVPYLQLVIPPALKRATIDVKIEVFKDSKPIKGWEMFRIGEQVLFLDVLYNYLFSQLEYTLLN